MPSFRELRSRAAEAEILGSKVWDCSRKDLTAMKRAAGWTRDIADLEDLDATARQLFEVANGPFYLRALYRAVGRPYGIADAQTGGVATPF